MAKYKQTARKSVSHPNPNATKPHIRRRDRIAMVGGTTYGGGYPKVINVDAKAAKTRVALQERIDKNFDSLISGSGNVTGVIGDNQNIGGNYYKDQLLALGICAIQYEAWTLVYKRKASEFDVRMLKEGMTELRQIKCWLSLRSELGNFLKNAYDCSCTYRNALYEKRSACSTIYRVKADGTKLWVRDVAAAVYDVSQEYRNTATGTSTTGVAANPATNGKASGAPSAEGSTTWLPFFSQRQQLLAQAPATSAEKPNPQSSAPSNMPSASPAPAASSSTPEPVLSENSDGMSQTNQRGLLVAEVRRHKIQNKINKNFTVLKQGGSGFSDLPGEFYPGQDVALDILTLQKELREMGRYRVNLPMGRKQDLADEIKYIESLVDWKEVKSRLDTCIVQYFAKYRPIEVHMPSAVRFVNFDGSVRDATTTILRNKKQASTPSAAEQEPDPKTYFQPSRRPSQSLSAQSTKPIKRERPADDSDDEPIIVSEMQAPAKAAKSERSGSSTSVAFEDRRSALQLDTPISDAGDATKSAKAKEKDRKKRKLELDMIQIQEGELALQRKRLELQRAELEDEDDD